MEHGILYRLTDGILKWKKTILILLIGLTVFFSLGLQKLYFYNKFTSWLDKDDPVSSLFIDLSNRFSINELIVVAVESPNSVFDQEELNRITAFCEQLQRVDSVFAVNSLSTMVDISRNEEGDVLVSDLLETAERLGPVQFAEYVVGRELYRSQIVSADKKFAMISVFIKGEFNSEAVLKNTVMPLAAAAFGSGQEIYYSGVPVNAHFLNLYSLQDLKLLSPMIFLLIALILFLGFRSLKGVVYPLLTVLLATIWTFGFIGHIGAPLTFVTAIIPVLLVAMGSAYGIHIVNHYQQHLEKTTAGSQPIHQATAAIFLPVLLAGITTSIGFLSFFTAGLTLIANFGLFSALGIAFSLIISLTLLPILSSWGISDRSLPRRREEKRFAVHIARFVVGHARTIFIICTVLTILFTAFIPSIDREVNFTEYFPKNSLPYRSQKLVEDRFKGAMPVIADYRSDNCKTPGLLRLLRKTENSFLGYGLLSAPLSITTLLSELNYQLNERYAVPESTAAVSNLWFFIEGRKELEQILSQDERECLVFSRFPDPRTRAQNKLEGYLKTFADGIRLGCYHYDIGGLSPVQRNRIRDLEALALKEEFDQILRGYHIDPGRRAPLLLEFNSFLGKSEETEPDSDIVRTTIAEYFSSSEFDWPLSPGHKDDLMAQVSKGFLKHWNSPGEVLTDIIQDGATGRLSEFGITGDDLEQMFNTLAYKIKENHQNLLVRNTVALISEDAENDNEQFMKRISSLCYDYLDDTALIVNPPEELMPLGEALPVTLNISGFPALMMQLDKSLFNAQVQSIILAYLLTLLLMIFIYRNPILGFVATIPIVFTVSIVYGSLGLFGISLDYATMLTGAVAIGVGIDYSIHLLHAALSLVASGLSLEEALTRAITEKAPAILTNAISVFSGFLILLFSAMLILRNFGATMMAAMILAALGTLFYLPAILLSTSGIIKIKIRRTKWAE